MPPSAFISYRRLPSAMLAQLIARELGEKYGIATYVDVRQSDGGGPFPDRLLRAIEVQDVFVCLLADSTLESEWVRREIEHAHNLGKTMIPVFQESYVPPADPDEHVRALLQYDGVQVLDRRNLFIDESVEQLAQFIHATIRQGFKQAQRAAPAAPAGHGRLWIGLVGAVLVVAAAVIAVLILSNGGGNGDKLDRTEVAQTVIAERDAAQTAAVLALTASATPEPSATPQPTATPTLEPTSTPTRVPSTQTPEPPATEVSISTATPSPIPAGSSNRDWTPVTQEFDGVPFVYVPAGCFVMGSEDGGYYNEKPVHEVCLSAYWIGQTEVTNAQYKQCVHAGACMPPGDRTYYDDPAYADHPVTYVDWNQAKAYAQWIGGSLPTEAQWEYAARGPEGWIYPWGNDAPTHYLANVWIGDNGWVGRTSPVGSYVGGASWVGALDMAGNVWEWAADYYDETYYASLGEGAVDPPGPASDTGSRVVRGGSWRYSQDFARGVCRRWFDPTHRDDSFGFRLVRVPQ